MKVSGVRQFTNEENQVTQEDVSFSAVGVSGVYPDGGKDENNTFAKWTPNASAMFCIVNPNLHGEFAAGDTFYVDFTRAD